MHNIDTILKKQREYLLSGETFDVNFRIRMLKKLYEAIVVREDKIRQALFLDLNKPSLETYMCEIGIVYGEIKYMLKNIRKFASKKYRKTPTTQFGSKSYTQNCPYGNVLIVAPWNYPIMLTLDPLVHAIATGNTAIVKPSAYSEHSCKIISELISETFDEKYIACITGGREQNVQLFDKKFDFVFFTGSNTVGREIAKKCAERLTPILLELGGKSPCVVDAEANIEKTAKRIVFGKFINSGQTCVAPDYVLCDNSKKDAFIKAIIAEIKKQYGEDPLKDETYVKIINRKHFDRVQALIDNNKVVYGGKSDETTLKIEPTVMDGVSFDDAVMQEEIFGPILPIIGVDNIEEAIDIIRSKPHPLALYVFTENEKTANYVTEQIQFGGGCINDTVIQLATSEMGFGGVGDSGMGAYHGKAGFEAFSHKKSIINNYVKFDLPARFRPYSEKKENFIRKVLK